MRMGGCRGEGGGGWDNGEATDSGLGMVKIGFAQVE